ncbi:MAG TPA: glycosyltransferase [Candidatus Saccharimonadales bacterium]
MIRAFRQFIRWEHRHRLIPHIVVFCILTFLALKFTLRGASSNDLLYYYGVLVTFVILLTFTLSFTLYRDPYEEALEKLARRKRKPKNPLVTCLVAVYNEEAVIEKCVTSVVNQTYKNKEIIFINDCSTDGTLKILRRLKKRYGITVIDCKKNVGKKGALARGVYEAKGTIFAFSDSDSIWAPDAVEKIVKIFRADEHVGAVSGHTRALNSDKNLLTKVQDSWYEGQYSIRKAFESIFNSVSCVSGPLAVFRKEAIYNYMPAWEQDTFLGSPFRFATDRTLTGFVLGSKQLEKKLKAKYKDSPFMAKNYPARNWKVVYCKSARAWTNVPESPRAVIKQQVRWKKSFIRNTFFTGAFFWRKPFPVAFVYYLHVAFVFLGPFVAFRHLIYLPLYGNLASMVLYLSGICFVGLMFGLAYKLENPDSHRWVYRPLMSLFSTLVLSWLIFYSIATVKKMVWSRG